MEPKITYSTFFFDKLKNIKNYIKTILNKSKRIMNIRKPVRKSREIGWEQKWTYALENVLFFFFSDGVTGVYEREPF